MRTCFSPWPGAWCPSLPTFTPTTWSPPSVAPSAPAPQTPVAQVGWQILTGTVRIYHVSVDCQESCIFLKWLHVPKVWSAKGNIVTRENVTLLVPPKCDILSIPDNFCYTRWSKFDDALWLTPLLSRVSNNVLAATLWCQAIVTSQNIALTTAARAEPEICAHL